MKCYFRIEGKNLENLRTSKINYLTIEHVRGEEGSGWVVREGIGDMFSHLFIFSAYVSTGEDVCYMIL